LAILTFTSSATQVRDLTIYVSPFVGVDGIVFVLSVCSLVHPSLSVCHKSCAHSPRWLIGETWKFLWRFIVIFVRTGGSNHFLYSCHKMGRTYYVMALSICQRSCTVFWTFLGHLCCELLAALKLGLYCFLVKI
jgi:hypothetical protein